MRRVLVTYGSKRGGTTFGGRLRADAKGLVAAAMARTQAGDWRDWSQIATWAGGVATELETLPRVMPAAPAAAPGRWLLVALCWFVALTAIGGGSVLVASPDGALMHAPLTLLVHSGFSSFLVPGLLLLVVVGIGNVIAGALAVRRHPLANLATFMGGVALGVWITVEIVLLRTLHWLQLGYLAIAVAIIALSVARQARAVPGSRWTPRRHAAA